MKRDIGSPHSPAEDAESCTTSCYLGKDSRQEKMNPKNRLLSPSVSPMPVSRSPRSSPIPTAGEPLQDNGNFFSIYSFEHPSHRST